MENDAEPDHELEAAADEAIALFGGDARLAVKALMIALQRETESRQAQVSRGDSGRWHARRARKP
jgi:hypothetical protein